MNYVVVCVAEDQGPLRCERALRAAQPQPRL